jgi:predicted ATPase
MGKSRLAHQAAVDAAPSLLHGAAVVSLAAVRSAAFLETAIAGTLGLSLSGGRAARAQLVDYLREKELLLVLDNFEHLVEGGTDLILALLRAAPEVTLLVTSRERLRLQGEHLLELEGLPLPADDAADIAGSAADLFIQRARQVRPDFAPAGDELRAIERICRLVEGLPLGVELAAAWVRLLTCREIAREIERGLAFLASSLRDAPERHSSLRAVVAHSWQALAPEERAALARLSVFRGGFGRAAAAAVAGASLLLLSALVDKSLVRQGAGAASGQRFDLHEFIRQYAAERLAESAAEREAALERYGRYYAALLAGETERLKGPALNEALAAIEPEIENVRAVWDWAVERRSVPELGQALESLATFYEIRGWFLEGEAAFGRAVAALAGADQTGDREERALLGRLLGRQAAMNFRLSRYEAARELHTRSLNLAREAGDEATRLFAVTALGTVAWAQGRYDEARRLGGESLALARALGDAHGAALALNMLGNAAFHQGDFAKAQHLHRESLAIRRAIGERRRIAVSLNNLANATWETGDHRAAVALYEEGLAMHREVGDRYGTGITLVNLADAARLMGDHEAARRHLAESLTLFREMGDRQGIAQTLNMLGSVALTQGEPAAAQPLIEESLAIYREIGNQEGIATTLAHLGRTLAARGETAAARACLRDGLAAARAIGALPVQLAAVVEEAGLLMREETPESSETAAVYLSVAVAHPACEQETRDRAARLLADLEGRVPESVAAGRERDGASDLDAIVADLSDRSA